MSHLVMFDVDGTLTLSTGMDDRCYVQTMFEHLGIIIDNDWSHYRQVTDSGIAAELFDRHQRPRKEMVAVRNRFVSLVRQSLAADPNCCRQVSGANSILGRLRKTAGVVPSLATGGWAESALAKLRHAGINVDGLAFASGDDAESRTTVMAVCHERAAVLANVDEFLTVTYIGDGVWDAHAAANLGWQFIGVGRGPHADRLRSAGAHHVVHDFSDEDSILDRLGIDFR
jgi:phosphoglycolate phosphatase-like HAD superfamily hydrolase